MSKGTLIKILINTFIGFVLVVVWLRFVDIEQILGVLSTTRLKILFLVFFFLTVSPVIRAQRLKILLSPVRKISLSDLIFLNGVAMMLNFFIPIRGGEIAKGAYLASNYDLPLGKSLVWIFLDRFLDFLTVLVIASFLLLFLPNNLPSNFVFITFGVVIILLTMAYLMTFKVSPAKAILKFLGNLLVIEKLKVLFASFYEFLIDTFAVFNRNPQELFLLFFLTALAYGADAAIWYFGFQALNSTQPFVLMYLGQLLSALTYLIPAAPGYIGSAEASGLLILSGIFGIENNLSSAMIVMMHIVTIVFVIFYGVISIYFLKVDLGQILKKILDRS